MIGYMNSYRVVKNNYAKIDSPTLYIKHNITMGMKVCEAVGSPETGYHMTALTVKRNNCYLPESVLNNWKDHAYGGKSLNAKTFGGWFVMWFFAFCFIASFPCLTIGWSNSYISILSAIIAAGIALGFAGFLALTDIRQSMGNPTAWSYKDGTYSAHARLDYYLKDRHGNLYTWSPYGFGEAITKESLGKKTTMTAQ